MSRYVEVDALKANCYITAGDTTIGQRDYVTFYEIESAPSIDIVKCKECKYWEEWRSEGGACYKALKVGFIVYRRPDDFCSSGERKGE